jgi:hypothetical protein
MATKRKYPVGVQSFESIRKDGYLYIDKTPLIYKMITEGKPYFLSRPRRFGKSLLVSTLAAVFEGRRELFEAFTTEDGIEQPQLFIATTDWRWEQHPVLRFDFSKDLLGIDELDQQISCVLADYEHQYGITVGTDSISLRMDMIVRVAHEQTGKRVVVLIDEYDKMMLHSIGDEKMAAAVRTRFKSLFSPLKSLDDHLQFVFITGISKFSQMGVFSTINQLKNISMLPAYDSICGISETELATQMQPDIELLASKRGETCDHTLTALKNMYDGYHFSEAMTDMYNPFSLINVFDSGMTRKFWFESATPSALIDMLRQMPPFELSDIDGRRCPDTAFDLPFDSYQNPLPALYQSGYLTIKQYQADRQMYTLGFPNQEVRTGFADCLYQIISDTRPDNSSRNIFLDAYYDFRDSDALPPFIEALKAFYAGVPYQWERDNKNEHYYHSLLYTLLVAFGADVRAEEPTAKGRSDLVLLMPKGIYVMEIKYDDTAEAALAQIDRKGYADKYALDGRPVTKVGIAFSSEERNITEWRMEEWKN